MSIQKTIIVNGIPVAKKRPRFTVRGKFAKVYNDQLTEEGRAYLEIKEQWNRDKPLDCPVKLTIRLSFPLPASASRRKVAAMLNGEIKHVSKPDADNAAKFYMDVMSGLTYLDDKQVYSLAVEKGWAEFPHTTIKLEWDN